MALYDVIFDKSVFSIWSQGFCVYLKISTEDWQEKEK